MRFSSAAGALTLLGLAACVSGSEGFDPVNTGVGFGDYQRYLAERDSAYRASSVPYSVPPEPSRGALLPPAEMPPPPSTLDAVPRRYAAAPPPAQPAASTAVTGQPLAAPLRQAPVPAAPPITTHPLAAPSISPSSSQAADRSAPTPPPAPMATAAAATGAAPGTPRPIRAGTGFGTTPAFDAGPGVRPTLSDEQDFNAVAARESIESDRERLQRQRAQYRVIEVTSVPDDSVSGGPNIIAYALETSHPPGTSVHRRLNPLRWSRWENACLQFRNQDAAQEAFLANGGPERDPGFLDPDGDGYACWWDPTPIRRAMASN